MVGPSKILTVSYGTFSCTLEGFDDPFSTMRSIAEYFRDLAADDRYFGAEPPTPDAEMLHRIAEREVQRRVETRVKGDGVVLRQLDTEQKGAPAAAEAAEEGGAAGTSEPRDTAAQEAKPHLAPNAGENTADAPVSGSGATTPDVPDETVVPTEPAAESETEDASFASEEERRLDPVEGIYAEDEEAEADAAARAREDVSYETPQPDDNSVAAKLSRIRAVVSGGAATRPVSGTDSRFAGSIDAAFAGGDVEDADFEDVTEGAPDRAEAQAEVAPEEVDPAVTDDALQSWDDTAEEIASVAAADVPETDAAEEEQDRAEPELGLAARIVKLKRAAHEMSHAEEAEADELPAGSLSDEDEAELRAELAEAEQEDTENLFHAGSEEADGGMTEDDAADGDHVPEAADDAMKAAIARMTEYADEAQDEGGIAEDDAGAEASDEDDVDRRPGFDAAKTEEAAFDRILEQTNTRMDEDEGSRRRSAIAHLKAAVAATKADRLLKSVHPEEEAAEEQSRYRDDLAKVVQPRPVTQPRDSGPTAHASPLVLVSEQRVDPQAPQHHTRTRDVDFGDASDDEGFSDFASKMGATDLPDLLEAAAAYTAFVEGNKLFSRPDLMRRVAHLDAGEEFTREAGLRSFGQLLRQGKIQKLKRGQFTITEETRFNPQARLAGE